MRELLKNLYDKRSRAYKAVFDNQNGKAVLADLRKFCFATGSPFNNDPYLMARNAGRYEVFERIRSYLHVTDDEIYRLTETLETEYDD